MRTRMSVSISEDPNNTDSSLLWYSRAIGIMRKRKFVDPTSWRFQAAVHDYNPSTDPYANPSDPEPDASIQRTYWFQCQHASWFFLPWHRMYLHFFEQIVANAVIEAGGPADWALPFWDYNQSDAARYLPWAFRVPKWPSGEVNYLHIDRRAEGINAGQTALSSRDADVTVAMQMPDFASDASQAQVEFGGPQVKWHEGGVDGSPPFGGVESSPHNNVHVAVGGLWGDPNSPTFGLMIDPTTAALDPIFWLHHANIDRLWELWLRQPNRANPADAVWLNNTTFDFYDVGGKPTTMTSSQVLDTTKLGYVYEGMPAPQTSIAPRTTRPPRRVEMLGATAKRFSVATNASTVAFSLVEPTSLLSVAEEVAAPERVMLHIEAIQSGQRPGAYDVYVNNAPGDAGDPSHFAGRISLFGTIGPRASAEPHAREGFSFVLDITKLYERLRTAGKWDAKEIQVTLAPVYGWSDAVRVGRVSLNVL